MKYYLPLLIFPILLVSCGSEPSTGERLIAQGAATRALGEQWNKGNSLIKEGEKQRKKGRNMIEDGEQLIKKGENNIERGKTMKATIEASAS